MNWIARAALLLCCFSSAALAAAESNPTNAYTPATRGPDPLQKAVLAALIRQADSIELLDESGARLPDNMQLVEVLVMRLQGMNVQLGEQTRVFRANQVKVECQQTGSLAGGVTHACEVVFSSGDYKSEGNSITGPLDQYSYKFTINVGQPDGFTSKVQILERRVRTMMVR